MSGPKESLHSYTPKISPLVYMIKDKYLYTCYDSQFYNVNMSWIVGDASHYTSDATFTGKGT